LAIEAEIDGMRLISTNVHRTHITELLVLDLLLGNKLVGKCHYFQGRGYYPPWIELDYDPWPRGLGLEVKLFRVFYDILPDQGRFFISYVRDRDTLNMLQSGFSPVDTPLGLSLLRAGFAWFKNWYFPEGGNEGGLKLQANKVLREEDRRRELEELSAEVKTPEARQVIAEMLAKGKP
jgi:Uncharacterized conserved protein